MALTFGIKLGPYEILSALGAGGMGEVYRARDTKLNRDVALKVLPAAMANDAERMARFEREAQVLASLNHPNIASIYGLEDSGGVRALVMELVEGPTLADKIHVAPGFSPARADLKVGATTGAHRAPLQLDETLHIAKQIAEALEFAHERGIIHRDLKPANIKITPDGAVKVLDFGLAKALAPEASGTNLANSPTISIAATQAGVILGTAAYMSPEQAKGKSVDRRTDIWAFGCVLYEMLTGKQTFMGETVSDVLAAVIMREPDWTALPADTPASIQKLLRRCLNKDSKHRLRDIGEARIVIEETLSGDADVGAGLVPALPQTATETARGRPQGSPLRVLPWAGMILFATLTVFFAVAYLERAPKPKQAVVSQILPPPGTDFALGGSVAGPPALSPDGKKLAFAAIGSDGKQLLWVRPIDSATAQPLAGTDGATYPFWSPDSRTVGFFANGRLNRIEASGGPIIALCDAPVGRGGSWGSDGTILFTPSTDSVIFRVPASGGAPTAVTKHFMPAEFTNRWPQFLPDGKHFLFYEHSYAPGKQGTFVASLDGGGPKFVVQGESNAVFAPPGYLLFIRQGTLMAQQFDTDGLRLAGQPSTLAENALLNTMTWTNLFTVSSTGSLAYVRGTSSSGESRLLWFDRSGKQLRQTGSPGGYAETSLSPDGGKLAATVEGTEGSNIWVFDVGRNVETQLTFSNDNYNPTWSPDGKMIAFTSVSGGLLHLYQEAADGTGKATPLVADQANEWFPEWSADGRYLVFTRAANTPASQAEIWAMPTFGDKKPFPVVRLSRFSLAEHALSPDGKWLAYMSAESGKPEMYVQPFPNGGLRWLVSTDNSNSPRWRRDSKELFYFSLSNTLIMSAQISERSSSLIVGKVAPLFKSNPLVTGFTAAYDVSADGKQFVVPSQPAEQASQPLTLVTNWPDLLKEKK